MMITLWCILTLIECISIYLYYKKTDKLFNHLSLFSIGFFLYLILPNLIGEIGIYRNEQFMKEYYKIFNNISFINKIISYIFITLIYTSFSYGTIKRKRKILIKEDYINDNDAKEMNFNLFKAVGILLLILSGIYIIFYSPAFFEGYNHNKYNKGVFAALVLVFFSYTLYDVISKIKKDNKILKSLINPYTIVYILLSILLLSIGTRLYFVANVFTILVLIEYRKKINFKKVILYISLIVLLVGVIGVVRSSSEFSIDVMIKNLLMEFLYTGLSLIKFIELGVFEIIKLPKFILSSIINLIPTIILPNKLEYVLNPEDYGYIIYNPQGALSIYTELMINFGFIGSIIVAFGTGYRLDRLREKIKNTLYLIMYSMISGFLIFSVFRDSFSGSLIKNILEFSIILPIFYNYVYKLSYNKSKKITKNPIVVQLNVSSNGSTGNIMKRISEYANDEKIKVISFYGRGKEIENKDAYKMGNKLSILCNVFLQRVFAQAGKGSYFSTKKLIKNLKSLNPSIIHLHNIHGYYLNYKILFDYLIKSNIKIIWTFHDCWAYTGHCAYYSIKGCNKWQKQCYNCCNLNEYPKTLRDHSSYEYKQKNEFAHKVRNLSIVTPSSWLQQEVKKSMFKKFRVQVINNGIDTKKFKYVNDKKIREKYNLVNKKVILGVASIWDNRKGLNYFIELSKILKEDEKIFLVGLNKKQIKSLPDNIIGIQRTENQQELIEIYSMANVFFNPSKEETFSLVTAEAMSCGVPSIVFNETAVPELIAEGVGRVITNYDIANIYKEIEKITNEDKKSYYEKCVENSRKYDISNYKQYVKLYKKGLEE